MSRPVPEQLATLRSGAAEVIPADELEARLRRSLEEERPLRVKLGIDPSRPDLHLGHAVVLRKLRRFQDLGHTAVLIIGDFTGRVGDPSGQSETRPFLSEEEIESNARTYLDQAGIVLDLGRAEVRRNSEWLAVMDMREVLRLTASATVARMLERDDFEARFREGKPISLVEFLYPLLQAMDSVAIRADVEMGGTDQTFNLLTGRDVQRGYGQDPQVVFTMPLLTGTDGVRKMSKSYGNDVGLTEPADEQFGKVMSIPDELIGEWFRLCTTLPPDEIDEIERALARHSLHPADAKRRLAREIVALYHGDAAAKLAEERFDRLFKRHEAPEEVRAVTVRASDIFRKKAPEVTVLYVPALLVSLGLAKTRSEARRLLEQGGIRRDGEVFSRIEERFTVEPGALVGTVWQVGKRRFAKVAGVR